MRKIIIIILLSASLPLTIFSQLGFELSGGPTQLGIGRAGVTMQGISAMFSNQAGLTYLEDWALEANVIRRFDIRGLDMISFAIAKNLGGGSVGLSIVQYGFSAYKEQKLGLAYARKLSKRLSIGTQFDLVSLIVQDFENQSFLTFEGGIYTELTSSIGIGVHVYSPAQVTILEGDDIPTRLRIGTRAKVSDQLTTFIEVEKVIDLSPVLKLGLDYNFDDNIAARIGAVPSLSEYSFGFVYSFESRVDFEGAMSFDDILGTTPAVGLRYHGGQKEKRR